MTTATHIQKPLISDGEQPAPKLVVTVQHRGNGVSRSITVVGVENVDALMDEILHQQRVEHQRPVYIGGNLHLPPKPQPEPTAAPPEAEAA